MMFGKFLILSILAFSCISSDMFEECDEEKEIVPGQTEIFESENYSEKNISKKYKPGINCRRHYTTQLGYNIFVDGTISLDRTPGVLDCAGQKNKFIVSLEGLKSLAHGEVRCTSSTIKMKSHFNRITVGYTSEIDDNRAGRFRLKITTIPVPKNQCECGWGLHSFRLVASREAYLGYASTVGFYKEDEDAIVCTGVVISPDYVLSSANCFPDPEEAKKLKIYAGYLVYPANEDDYQATYEIESVVVHENYQTSPNIYNVAIIKTIAPISYSLGVSPICMPTGKLFQSEDFYGRTRTFDLVAWPKYNGDGAEQNLLNETKYNMPISTCSKYYSELYGSKNHICTNITLSDTNAEQNGAILTYTSSDRRYAVGVYIPPQNQINGYPTTYLRLSNIMSWIVTQAKNTSFCSKMF